MERDIKSGSDLIEGRLFELHVERAGDGLPYLVVAKDPGAANCLSPVVEGLLAKNRRLHLFSKDRALEIFERNFFSRSNISESSPESIATGEPTVVLAAGTSGPEYEGKIIDRIKKANPRSKLVLIEDFPGSLVLLMQELAGFETPISPELVFVTSRTSQENMHQRFPGLKGNIIPVGQPAFDSLLLEDTQTVSTQIRERLQIQPGDLLLSYSGVPSQDRPGENAEALKQIVSALNSITNRRNVDIYFVNRNHPREADPAQFNPILEAVSQRVKIIDEFQHREISTREITAASNLVITTISTTGLETALRGCRPQTKLDHTGWLSVHIYLPQAREFIERTAGSLPVIELGATGVAIREHEVESVIEQSLFDRDFKQRILDAQKGPLRNEYRFYGQKTSTDRVLLWLRYFEKNE